jgi:hypothetical protein
MRTKLTTAILKKEEMQGDPSVFPRRRLRRVAVAKSNGGPRHEAVKDVFGDGKYRTVETMAAIIQPHIDDHVAIRRFLTYARPFEVETLSLDEQKRRGIELFLRLIFGRMYESKTAECGLCPWTRKMAYRVKMETCNGDKTA